MLLVAAGAAAITATLVARSLFLEDRRTAEILEARLEGPSTLVLTVSACNAGSNEVDLVERRSEVVLTVTTDDPVGGDDCADGVTVALEDPLGDRRIVDGGTGEAVELTR